MLKQIWNTEKWGFFGLLSICMEGAPSVPVAPLFTEFIWLPKRKLLVKVKQTEL